MAPSLLIKQFPATNLPVLIVFLELLIPAQNKFDLGLHVVPTDGAPGDEFGYANIFEAKAVASQNNQIGRAIFILNVPEQYKSANIALASGSDDPVVVGVLKNSGSRWRYEVVSSVNSVSRFAKRPPRFGFVGGAPKSGTTWVQNVLNLHRDVMCAGEGNLMGPPEPRNISPNNPWLPDEILTPESYGKFTRAGAIHMIFRAMHDLWPHELIVDRTPGNSGFYFDLVECFPDAKLIHCTRDPLDVAVSRAFHEANLIRNNFPHSIKISDDEIRKFTSLILNDEYRGIGKLFQKHWSLLREILDEWVEMETAFDSVEASFPGVGFRTRYESLVTDTHNELTRLFRFLEVSATSATIQSIGIESSFEALSSGRTPGVEDRTSFFRKGVVNDHLNYFNDQQIREARAYIETRRYGLK